MKFEFYTMLNVKIIILQDARLHISENRH